MTALAWSLATIAILYALAMTGLFAIFWCDRREHEQTIEGLRDQLHAEQQSARHWYGVARGYHDDTGRRTTQPRARDVQWTVEPLVAHRPRLAAIHDRAVLAEREAEFGEES